MAEERDLTYINKDFTDLKEQLVNYAKNYFPDTYNDFSPSSPGMMFIEMAAYVGDVLSFYQDTQLQETYLTYAKDPKNLFNLAYMMGYKPKVTGVSEVELEVTQVVDASGSLALPDWSQAALIEANSIIRSTDRTRTKFLIDKPIDFSFSSSYDPTEVLINSPLDGNGNPITYTLRKKVKAFSGEVVSTTFNVDTFEKFKTLTVSDNNIIGVLDVIDSDDRKWTEVPFLGQDTIFDEEANTVSETEQVPYILQLKKAPRRFVTRFRHTGDLDLQFGSGITGDTDEKFLPDPSLVALGTGQGTSKLDTAYDPSNFLFSNSYGVAPLGSLTVRYIKGGGVSSNVPAFTITEKYSVNISNGADIEDISFTNPKPASGGRDGDSVEELRENSLRSFNEQNRVITLQDYTVRALSLPSKFGSIAKAYATQDSLTNSNLDRNSLTSNNPLAVSLYVLAYDTNKKFIATPRTLKQNLKTYMSQYMPITDSLSIRDAFVVNIGVVYDIVVRPDFAGRDVLLDCNLKIQEYFAPNKVGINQPINLSNLYRLLDRVKGVQTVKKVEITNKTGGNYSEFGYDIAGATKDNIVYPSYDPCIFELKYPEQDIKGRVTKL
jgi:hypothetical protein